MNKTFATLTILAGFFLFSSNLLFAENGISYNLNFLADTNDVAKAHALHKKVVEEDRIVRSLDEALAVTLPQGIKKEIGGVDYIIVIESVSFTPQGSRLTAYMSVEVPKSGKRIAFKGKDLEFVPGGFTGGARLELMEDVDIPLGKNMTMVLKGDAEDSKTFVECDCDGYKEMGLKGEIQFSRKKMLPEGPDGNIIADPNVKVKAEFETKFVDWNEFMLEVGITPFQVKDMKGFSFSVTSAVFDFSEVANAPSMTFPKGYESSDFIDGNRKTWTGFFLKDLVVKLPKNLSKKSGKRSTVEAHNLLIDNIGVSGKFMATHIFTRNEGDMSKWAFSLDEISAEITKNQLVSCGFSGTMNVPPLGDSTILGYEAFIDPANQYTFIVNTTDTLNMDMWAAKLRLDPNSYVDISVIDGKFRPKAVLNGNLSVATKKVELADVEFEELTITPEAPYVKAKSFSFGSEYASQKLGKFPIAITDIGMVTADNRTGLKFNLMLNLVKSGSGGFAGETGLVLYAKSYEENNRQRWKYDGFEVNKIAIDIDQGAFKLKGSAQFYKNDPIYGNGFSGNIEAEFSKLPKLSATAIFGNVGGMRYFYADAMVNFNSGVPVFGGLFLYGLGGGVYHHMSQLGWDEKATGDIGKTASGIVYKPDQKTLFGFKATVAMGLKSKSIFNGDLTFEMAFNNSCGVSFIGFRGNGYFMTPPEEGAGLDKLKDKAKDIAKGKDPNDKSKKDKDPGRSSLYAYVDLRMDFEQDVFHGVLGTYINLPGGIIQGAGPGGKAGEAVIHFAKDEWYIYVGTPTDRFGLKVLNFAQLDAYFVMGTKIPASPPPPAKVSDILGGIDLDYMANENALGEGKGIGFGAGINISTGDLGFPPFYASFDAGMGFDVMLKNYGNVACKGQSEPLGINGWYANGQVWAYIEGAIGIKVNLRFIKGRYEILKVGAAAVLQAKLPNPFWMRGIVGGRYSILGGLVSGNCRFQFELGEECEIVGGGSPVQAIQVIAEATPGDGSTDVNVFNAAQAVFNMPIGKTFELQDLDGKNIAFKIELEHFKVLDGSTSIQGDLEWNTEKDVVAFNSFEILPPKKQLKLDIQVSFKEKKNGSWQTVIVGGQKVIETLQTTFTTGEAPDFIPLSNVKYSYPMPMMFNYYQNESDLGYIQLIKGQDYLFNPGNEWKQVGRFVDKQGNIKQFNFNYNASQKKVSFTRPGNLQNNAIYSFELVNVPAQAEGAVDKNVKSKVSSTGISEGNESTIDIKSKQAEGTLNILDEKNIFKTNFRTSLYNTLSSKLNAMQHMSYLRYYLYPTVHNLYIYNSGNEMFSEMENEGFTNSKPFIQFSAKLDNKWYSKLIAPIVYNNYPYNNLFLGWRTTDSLGIPPVKAIRVFQYPKAPSLTEDQLTTGIENTQPTWVGFKYALPYYMNKDYFDLKQKAASKYYNVSSVPKRVKYLLENSFLAIYKGDYNVILKYVLPGINTVTSTSSVKFVSPVGVE